MTETKSPRDPSTVIPHPKHDEMEERKKKKENGKQKRKGL